MHFFHIMVAATAVSLGAQATAATGVLYDCDITRKKDPLYWIGEKMAIIMRTNGEVFVSDQIILANSNRPMAARIAQETQHDVTIEWTLGDWDASVSPAPPDFRYAATLTKDTHQIVVFAHPDGFAHRYKGTGQCRLVRP